MNDADILNTVYGDLAQVSLDYKAGKISEEEFTQRRAELERTLRAMEGTATPYRNTRQDYPAKGDPSFKYDPGKITGHKKGTKGVRHNPKKEGRPHKVGVEKGYGPRHAANAKEGDLTQVDTDTVPAMLTPREAVLNRNAAEMAGRGNIEALNEKGNLLAKRGVDLAGEGENMKSRQKLQGGDDAVKRNPFPGRGAGGVYPGVPPSMPPDQIGGFGGGLGARDEFGRQFSQRNEQGFYGAGHGVPQPPDPRGSGPFGSPMGYYNGPPIQVPQPAAPPSGGATNWGPSAPFYPPGQGLKMAQGEEDILGNSGSIYGSAAPVQLSSPGGLSDLVQAILGEAKKQGLSPSQIQGLLGAAKGIGGMGGGGIEPGTDPVGYAGGISDIGYPPFVAPNADYHADKGGWQGPYDRNYFIPNYG